MRYIKDYSAKSADEWFGLKKWTGFLVTIPIGRTVVKECENMREVMSIRTTASILTNDADCDRRFSVETESSNERMICVRADKK